MGIIDNSRAVDAAVNTVAQIREAFGNEIEFGLDFHGRVSAPMAKVLIKELEPYRPLFIEEPVLAEQAEYYPRLAAQTHIPIAAGERMFSRFEFKRVLEAGGVAILQPDLSHAGGITECYKMPAWRKPMTLGWRRTVRWGRSRWQPVCTLISFRITRSSRSRAWGSITTKAPNCLIL